MSSKTLVLNTTHTKPVLSIENFENMTLEERLELLNNTYIKMMHGFFGSKWQDV
jgi:hypothetical protein